MKKNLTKTASIFAVALALVVTATGCSFNSSEPESANEISLTDKSDIGNAITWNLDTTKLPEGWTVNSTADSGDETDPESVPQNPLGKIVRSSSILIESKDKKCSALLNVTYSPSYLNGHGDLYLSKNAIYELAQSNDVAVNKESTSSFKTADSTLEFVTADFSYDEIEYSYDEDGNEIAPPKPSGNKIYVSLDIRSLDQLKDLPETGITQDGLYGSDSTKGIPTLGIEVECVNEVIPADLKESLSNAVSLEGIAASKE